MADEQERVLLELERQLHATEAEAAVLARVLEHMTQNKCFRQEELDPIVAGIARREQRAAQLAATLESKRRLYASRVQELRRLIARREDVLDRLEHDFQFMDSFEDEAGVVLEVQTRLTLELEEAVSQMHE